MNDTAAGNGAGLSQERTFALVTLGCKVNQYESQAIREDLCRAGFEETGPLDKPDVVVINSCGVTGKSAADSRRWINRIRRTSPRSTVVATGCCTEIAPDALTEANVIVPQAKKYALLNSLEESGRTGRDTGSVKSNVNTRIGRFDSHVRAFLKVQDGCARSCSYCAVPLARGRPVSKPLDDVLNEAAVLSEHGHPEIVLCGIDLGSYGKDLGMKDGPARLIESLITAPGRARFRLSSIDVRDVSDPLLAVMASSRRICPHLHIPLQSGSSSILTSMRRNYTPEQFLDAVRRIRTALDDPGITTDCMVAFPGETEEDFMDTLSVCRESAFSKIHVFRFSPRPGTSARVLHGRLPEEISCRRARILIEEGERLADSYRKQLTDSSRKLDVLVEKTERNISYGLAARYVRVRTRGVFSPGTRFHALPAGSNGTYIEVEVCDE